MVHILLKPGLENFEHYFTAIYLGPNYGGIHEYDNEEEAMKEILAYYQKRDNGKSRQLLEIHEVPEGLTWQEWNAYLDELAKEDVKCL